jgi:1,4-dihydroxy-6-naphthoate synthase
MRIRVGHSADPDDAFMFWALDAGAVDARGFEFEQVVSDIETLNGWATEGRLEVTALSMGAYAEVADTYVLLPHGASFGIGYGPVLVAREELDPRETEIVIPGRRTTAYQTLRFALGEDIRVRELPFDEILDEVVSGRADAGLLIHEGQLTYAAAGLHKLLDLGVWWQEETGLPLPLGLNAARRDLGDRLPDVSAVLGEAIRVGLDRRGEALAYAERFGRGIDRETADRFVAMYVNELTCDYRETGRRAVDEFLRRAGSSAEAQYV